MARTEKSPLSPRGGHLASLDALTARQQRADCYSSASKSGGKKGREEGRKEGSPLVRITGTSLPCATRDSVSGIRGPFWKDVYDDDDDDRGSNYDAEKGATIKIRNICGVIKED